MSAKKPNQMQMMLIALWALKGKAPTKKEVEEFYEALLEAGKP